MIERDPNAADFPFAPDGLITITADGLSHVVGPLKELVQGKGFAEQWRSPAGLGGAHGWAQLEVFSAFLVGNGGACRGYEMPLRIEVRDIFEEAWREVADDFGSQGIADNSALGAQIDALKAYCHGAGTLLWALRRTHRRRHTPAKELTISTETTQDAIGLLREVLPDRLHDLVVEIYARRARAVGMVDRVKADALFAGIRTLLEELCHEAAAYLDKGTTIGRPVRYLLEMERAFCLLAGSNDDRRNAIAIYKGVEERYPNDVLAYYRHGVTTRKLGGLEESVPLFAKALELLRAEPDASVRRLDWIRVAVPRNLGLSYWWMAEKERSNSKEFRSLAKKAVEYTESAHTIANNDRLENLKTVNNLTYFIAKLLHDQPEAIPEITAERLIGLVKELEAYVSVEETDDFVALETLASAYRTLNERDKMLAAISRVHNLVRGLAEARAGRTGLSPWQIREYLHEDEQPALDSVLDILISEKLRPI